MLDDILSHVWSCVAYRNIYLLNFTEAFMLGRMLHAQ